MATFNDPQAPVQGTASYRAGWRMGSRVIEPSVSEPYLVLLTDLPLVFHRFSSMASQPSKTLTLILQLYIMKLVDPSTKTIYIVPGSDNLHAKKIVRLIYIRGKMVSPLFCY